MDTNSLQYAQALATLSSLYTQLDYPEHLSGFGSHLSPLPGFSSSRTPWTNLTSLLLVPQRRWPRKSKRTDQVANGSTTIDFGTHDGGHLIVSDALKHKFTGLICRDEVLEFKGSSIYLRVEWPGYKSWNRQIKITDYTRSRKPITGAKLVYEIAKSLKLFIQHVQDQVVDNVEQDWKFGPADSGLINVDNVVIISLRRVSRGSWQADFGVASAA